MKEDLDTLRQLALQIWNDTDPDGMKFLLTITIQHAFVAIDGDAKEGGSREVSYPVLEPPDKIQAYHLYLLRDRGLATQNKDQGWRLTSKGQDFCKLVCNDRTWVQVRDDFAKQPFSLATLQRLLTKADQP